MPFPYRVGFSMIGGVRTNLTILIADDEPKFTRALSRLLKRHGFVTREALSIQAVKSIVNFDELDFVLLDLHLGKSNGWEILRALREASRIPVIMMTGGRLDSEMRTDAEVLGAQDFLQKPFEIKILIEAIGKYS